MDRDLRPGPGVVIPAGALRWRFSPSGGPGGQHANRSSTRVELSVALDEVPGLDPEVLARLEGALGPTVSVVVDETRSQHRNREIALDRLEARLRGALTRRPARKATRPSASARRRRLAAKRYRSELKRYRRPPSGDDR